MRARRIRFDALGGAAGDMIVAALLDAFPEHEGGVLESIRRAAPAVDCAVLAHNDGVLQGRRFKATLHGAAATAGHDRRHAHGHDDQDHHVHAHDHRAWKDIRRHLQACGLDAAVARRAIAIFAELADAEGRVHGIAAEDVTFHEVGAWDSVADIVGAAHLIAASGCEAWTVGGLPLGSGRVRTAHGVLPVPAPATALLLEGFETIDDGVGGERVTPTGAAILRHLCRGRARGGAGVLAGSGVGFGARVLPGVSNCLRVLVFDEAPAEASAGQVCVVEFEIDDQSAEDLATALDRLRAMDGVLDAVQAPAFGKKGRMMTAVRLLAAPGALAAVTDAVFAQTTTIGLRHHLVARTVLPRRARTLAVGGASVRVKLVERPGGAAAKAEADDLTGDLAERTALRRRAEDAALKGEG